MLTVIFPFRSGQRWSWFAMWILPASMVMIVVYELQGHSNFVIAIYLFAAALLGLVFTYRRFILRRSGDQ